MRLLFAAAGGAALVLLGGHLLNGPKISGIAASAPNGQDSEAATSGANPLGSVSAQQIRMANLQLSQQQLRDEIAASRAMLEDISSTVATHNAQEEAPSFTVDTVGSAQTVHARRQETVANTEALVAAGISEGDADAMVQRLDELALARLNADHEMTKAPAEEAREWARVRREIPSDRDTIRAEFGDSAYDQYLYSLNQPNRVEVASVLRESTAHFAGIQNGDYLRSFDGERLYRVRDYTRRIRDSDAGRSYSLVIERNGREFEIWLPGGPLGLRVSGAVAQPGS